MIYCGGTCALKQEEREEEIVLLRQEMVELQKENVEKEKYIDSLRKKSSAFEEDVIDIETSYRDEIQSNQRVISNLNIMLDEKDRRIAALNVELQELKHSKEVLQDEIYKLKNIDEAKRFKCEKRPNFRKTSPKGDSSNQTNRESASPNTDSQCNRIYRDASCTSKNGSDPADVLNSSGPEDNTSLADPPSSPNSARCCDSSAQSDVSAAFVSHDFNHRTVKKSQVIIIGDEHAKNCSAMLNSYVDSSEAIIQGIVKPGVDFYGLVKPLFNHSLYLGKDDYIVVMFNTFNVSNHRTLLKALQLLLPLGKVTNIVIMSKLHHWTDISIENIIHSKVQSFVRRNRNTSINFFRNVKQKN
nr:unnamed protein product [Callosobruchus analis]